MDYSNRENFGLIEKLKYNQELVNAILAGLIILLAWRMSALGMDTAAAVSFLTAFVIGGYYKAREGIKDTIESKKLNVEILMILAAIGSAIIGYWLEGAILIFIFAMSGALETYVMNKSSQELSSLMELQPEEAWLVRGGFEPIKVAVQDLKLKDHILVKPGEHIPIDGVVYKGQSSVDEAAISGESLPVTKHAGENVYAGTVNLNGALTIAVTKLAGDTMFQKIISLVQSAQNEKTPSQQFIDRFESVYVKVILITVIAMMFLPMYLLDWDFTTSFYRAMVLLVVASPCALVASITPAMLSAISNGARNGILVKSGVHLEQLKDVKVLAVDKTGTLTEGKPVVTDFVVCDGLNSQDVLALFASIEARSSHPLAEAIVKYAQASNVPYKMDVDVKDIPGHGMEATANGKHYKIGKPGFVGSDIAHSFQDDLLQKLSMEGKTVVFMRDEQGIVALAAMKDTVRPETIQAVKVLQSQGIKVVMLTGDNEQTAAAIAKEVGVDDYKAECLPATKVEHIKEYATKYGKIAMVGDGINDAPALATADIGIAMGAGTDVALETADVVLMKNDLTKIQYATQLSKKANRIVKQNIAFSVIVIIALIFSNFMQVINLPIGVIGHEGSTILVILNGLRLLKSL